MSWRCFQTVLIWAPLLIDKDSWLQRQWTSKQRRQIVFRHSCWKAFGKSPKRRNPISSWQRAVSTEKCFGNNNILGRGRGGKHLLLLGPESGRTWWLKKVQYIPKSTTANEPSCVERTPSGFFTILAICYNHWNQFQHRVGDCISKAKVISIRAPRYRQYALISDLLDLDNLSVRKEAGLATNWIKDRPEGLKLRNLALATVTGPAVRSSPKNVTAYVQ